MYKKATLALSLVLVGVVAYYFIAKKNRHESENSKWKATPGIYADTVTVAEPGLKGYILTTAFPKPPEFGQLNYQFFGHYMIMDMTGKIIVQKDFPNTILDFKQWRIGGKVYYTYFMDDTNCYHNPKMKRRIASGPFVVLDSALNEIKKLNLIENEGVKNTQHQNLDGHDLLMLGEDHFIVFANFEKEVDNIPASLNPPPHKKVYAAIIQETVNGKVVWQWDATKFPEFYGTSVDQDGNGFSDTTPTDYIHLNSMVLDPNDSNLVVSFRSLNQIVKIDRHTGNILWRLGGKNSDFPLEFNQKFLGQHYVKFLDDNKTLMFIDNGNVIARPSTRILEFRLDEANKKVAYFNAYKIPERYIPYRGSVQKVGENLLITGGGYDDGIILLTDPKTDRYLFHLRTRNQQCFYRSYWVDSIYGLEKKQQL